MMKALVIEDIKVITTAPEGINLVAVKVTTNLWSGLCNIYTEI